MKQIDVSITYDAEFDDKEEHLIECLATVNGRHYYDCLQNILHILQEYDKKKDLTKAEKKVLNDLRNKCAPNFKGI